jgi:hypothetical protein
LLEQMVKQGVGVCEWIAFFSFRGGLLYLWLR